MDMAYRRAWRVSITGGGTATDRETVLARRCHSFCRCLDNLALLPGAAPNLSRGEKAGATRRGSIQQSMHVNSLMALQQRFQGFHRAGSEEEYGY